MIGKGDKEREIPIGGEFWIAYERSQFEPIPRLGFPEPDHYFWFPMRIAGEYGNRERQVTAAYPDRPMSPRAFHEWWERLVGHSGVDYRKLHTTRHTYATAALEASDGDVYGVKEVARACVGQDDGAVSARRQEGQGVGGGEARRGPPRGPSGSPVVTTISAVSAKEAHRRSRKPAWLRRRRRLADSNCCNRHKAGKSYFPANRGVFANSYENLARPG